ncbi:hypothetical protein ES703_126058 [subsurface metagenome]
MKKTKFSEPNPYFKGVKPGKPTATEVMMNIPIYYYKWYQKILLAFLPMRYVGDDEFGIYYKRWRGNTFVYRIKRGRKPTLIFQDEVVNGS